MNSNNIRDIYSFLRGRENPIIIGLTGALGAGCSTVAKILNERSFLEFIEDFLSLESSILDEFNCKKNIFFDTLERYRYERLKTFYLNLKRDLQQEKCNSQKIYIKVIKVSRILEFILKEAIEEKKSNNELKELMNKIDNIDPKSSTDPKEIFKEIESEIRKILKKILNGDIEKLYEVIFKGIEIISWAQDESNSNNYEGKRKRLLQELGRFIKRIPVDGKIPPVFNLAKIIDQVISKDLEKEETMNSDRKIYIIDAFRNPFEIEYFKNKYNQFYLFSILADKEVRKHRLRMIGFKDSEIASVQNIENREPKNKDELFEQNINFCILKGDIFINNNNNDPKFKLLKYQLGKYIALILKPGLVTPTKDELYMQLAFTAKNMSGCISRQVGAVVVGQDGYIRGVGWNDPPEKFVPCLYRTLKDLKNQGGDCCNRYMFSEYECFDQDFRAFIEEVLNNFRGSILENPFCFKDLENKRKFNRDINLFLNKLPILNREHEKLDQKIEDIRDTIKAELKNKLKYRDPSRERALHAEENAFLQASKIGGAPVKGGTLYSTAFPCQLCSKKTRQLFISRIVYIEDYPDISYLHTLKGGDPETEPKVDIFTGVIGQSFFKLYSPYIPTKDELKLFYDEYRELYDWL
jgi:deoxycytidylate deaminase